MDQDQGSDEENIRKGSGSRIRTKNQHSIDQDQGSESGIRIKDHDKDKEQPSVENRKIFCFDSQPQLERFTQVLTTIFHPSLVLALCHPTSPCFNSPQLVNLTGHHPFQDEILD